MNTTVNKKIATEFFARLAAKDATGALALTSDDMQWWMPPGVSGGGTWLSKAQESANFTRLFSLLDGAFRQHVVGMTAEDDRVAVEVEVEVECDTAMTLRYWRGLTGQDPPA